MSASALALLPDDIRAEILGWCDTRRQIGRAIVAAPVLGRQHKHAVNKLADRRRFGRMSLDAPDRKLLASLLPLSVHTGRGSGPSADAARHLILAGPAAAGAAHAAAGPN